MSAVVILYLCATKCADVTTHVDGNKYKNIKRTSLINNQSHSYDVKIGRNTKIYQTESSI